MADRKLVRELQAIVGRDGVIHAPEDLLVYEYDATIERGLPEAVVLPTTAEQVSQLVKLARRRGLPVVARGAGTGLSGGAIPAAGGLMLAGAILIAALLRKRHVQGVDLAQAVVVGA